jgi:hypothetical protein
MMMSGQELISRAGRRWVALMDLAVRQALRSACRCRVGAVLVAGNRVLAAGPNLRRNNPMVDFRHATFHAEEVVLRRVRAAPPGAEIFVARVSRAGVPLLLISLASLSGEVLLQAGQVALRSQAQLRAVPPARKSTALS